MLIGTYIFTAYYLNTYPINKKRKKELEKLNLIFAKITYFKSFIDDVVGCGL